MTKKRKISEESRNWYVLGYINGVAEADRQIKLYQTTNKQLWKELQNLDKAQPLVGVLIGRNTLERMIRGLKREATRGTPALIKKLQKAKEESERTGKLVVIKSTTAYTNYRWLYQKNPAPEKIRG